MKKFLIIISVLLLTGAVYFTYERWVKHAKLTAWSFMPSDAALVLEMELQRDFSTLQSYNIWKTFEKTSAYSNIGDGLAFLDSINGEGGFSAIFKDTPALISLHRVSSTALDYLFVVDVQNLSQNTFISATIGRLKEAGYQFKTRNYNGFSISEVRKAETVFTYIFYKNYFLASFTPYLVEDAIRTIDSGEIRSFEEEHLLDADGNIHVNFKELENLVEVFTTNEVNLPLTAGSFQLMADSSFVTATGISTAKDWLAVHTDEPSQFEIASIIPANTSMLYHFSSRSLENLKEGQTNYLSGFEDVKRLTDSLKTTIDFNPEQVFDLVDEEIGLARIESGRIGDDRKLFILKVKNTSEALNYFQQVTERIAYARGDSVYTESYNESEIRFLPIQDFPKTLLGNLAGDFNRCFYLSYQNYIIFSNNLEELKDLTTMIESEETWGKSIQINEFLERSNREANVSLFVNIPRIWSQLFPNIHSKWSTQFKANESNIKQLDLVAFQFSYIDNSYYSSITLSQPMKAVPNIAKTSSDNAIRFASPMITKPYLVRSHAHNDFDILAQDSTHTLYFLNKSLSSIWTEKLDEPIVSEVFQIDYYRNAKLQYLFATSTKVHIIDRTGAYIPGYPKQLPRNSEIQHLNLIDYDRSRNYRIGITDVDGKVYLTDKELKLLEGWDPIPYTRAAVQPLKHARLGRRDIMISIQENGVLNVTNRRGAKQSGFPFDTQSELAQDYYLSSSNSLGSSSLSVLSKQGELIEINLEGIVINRDQLIKESSETVFELVNDRGRKSFIIVRKEDDVYDILDSTGNLLFSKDYFSSEEILIQYYQFGAGKDLIIFTDTATNTLYVFDKSGNLITGNPLRSSKEVSVIYSSSKKELQIYTASGNDLEYYVFSY